MRTYILKDKEQQPTFKYFVQKNNSQNYYLFNDFEKAYNKMKELSNAYILEPIFAPIDREWKMRRTFICRDSKTDYLGNSGDILLHTKFYCDTGECINYILFEKGLD
jgi:hypothetical protein